MEEEQKEVELLDPVEETTPIVEPVVETTPAVEDIQQVEPVVETTPSIEEVGPAIETTPVVEAPNNTNNIGEKPKKKKPILLIILLLLLIVGIVVAIVLLKPFDKKKEIEKEKEKEVVDTPSEIKYDYKMTGNSLEPFDLYFLKLDNNKKNMVYSPLSIKYALEMLSEGANGHSKAQLDAVIGDYEAKKYTNNNKISFANAMFIRDKFKDYVKDEYKQVLSDKYGAEVKLDAFKDPKNINKWISDKTFGRIDDLVSSIDDDDFFLVNALGIDMNWVNQLHCSSGSKIPCKYYYVKYYHEKLEGEDSEYTNLLEPYSSGNNYELVDFEGKGKVKGVRIAASFNRYNVIDEVGLGKIGYEVGEALRKWIITNNYANDDEIDVNKYLSTYTQELYSNYGKAEYSTDFSFYVDDNVKVFAKDLETSGNTTLQYVGIMPVKESLSDYVSKVTPTDINGLINNLIDMKIENFKDKYVTIIEGTIPLFEYEYDLKLKEALEKLGITDVFSLKKADLSGMVKETPAPVAIFDAKHKANIEFSNDGIKAAAATEIGGGMGDTGEFNYLYEVPTIRINITFDKPYMYLIRDKESNEVWFVGTVYEPSK